MSTQTPFILQTCSNVNRVVRYSEIIRLARLTGEAASAKPALTLQARIASVVDQAQIFTAKTYDWLPFFLTGEFSAHELHPLEHGLIDFNEMVLAGWSEATALAPTLCQSESRRVDYLFVDNQRSDTKSRDRYFTITSLGISQGESLNLLNNSLSALWHAGRRSILLVPVKPFKNKTTPLSLTFVSRTRLSPNHLTLATILVEQMQEAGLLLR